MDNDNIYPFNSRFTYKAPPKEQVKSKDEQVKETRAQLPLLNKTVEHLDKRITFYDSVDSIPDEVKTKPEEFMHIVAAHKLTKDNLIQERDFILVQIKNATR